MLTAELLKGNIEGLTDEQISALEVLSKNDEDRVIGQRFGEVYRDFDNAIAASTGIAREGSEKTTAYLKRAAEALKVKADNNAGLQDKLTELQGRYDKLVADGGSEEMKQQLAQYKTDNESTRAALAEALAGQQKIEKRYQKEMLDYKVGAEFDRAASALKFKPDYSQNMIDVLRRDAVRAIKEKYNPAFEDNVLVFRDKEGKLAVNPADMLKPYGAAELLTEHLRSLGALDEGTRGNGGAGGNGNGNNNGGSRVVSLAGAKTRTEADDIIVADLLAKGLVSGTAAFTEARDAAWRENNVMSLPMQ
jgi:hypothetical protein